MKSFNLGYICSACALLLFGAGAHSAPAQTNCVNVVKSTYAKEGAELGVTSVHWQADLSNDCNASYDADLLIQFVDANKKVIYHSRDLVSVARHAGATAKREFNIPVADFDRIEEVIVQVTEERERPF